jgi:hypothetical protein
MNANQTTARNALCEIYRAASRGETFDYARFQALVDEIRCGAEMWSDDWTEGCSVARKALLAFDALRVVPTDEQRAQAAATVKAKCEKAFKRGSIGRARFYYYDGDTGKELAESPNLGNGPSPIGPDGARMRNAREDTLLGTPVTLHPTDFPGRAVIVKDYHPDVPASWFWLTTDPAVAMRPLPRFCRGGFEG